MTREELTRLQNVLGEAESIISESLEKKRTSQDLALKKALLKLRIKVYDRMAKLKS